MVLAIVPAAPPTKKKRRATSWPAPISANVPYFSASILIWSAFRFVSISISGFIENLLWPVISLLRLLLRLIAMFSTRGHAPLSLPPAVYGLGSDGDETITA